MTRALTHAVRLDFAGAFYYHPLWFAVPPAVLYLRPQDAWRRRAGSGARQVLVIRWGRPSWPFTSTACSGSRPAIRVDFGASAVARLFARLTA